MKAKSTIYIFIFCFLLLIFSTRGFQFIGWRLYVRQVVEIMPALLLLCTLINYYNKVKADKSLFSSTILYLCIYPVVMILLKPYIAGGPVIIEVPAILAWTSVFALYFVWEYYNVSENVVVCILLTFGLLTFALQVWQQINSHIPLFGVSKVYLEGDSDQIATMRNNLYRLRIGSFTMQLICLFYCWSSLFKRFNIKKLIFFSFFLVSIYLYLTRQIIIVAFVVLIMSLFLNDNLGTKKKWGILLVFFGGIMTLRYWDVLFSSFVEDYQNDTFTTDIRQESSFFFIDKMLQNILTFLLGHGHQFELENIWARKEYYLQDVGFIGECYYFGVIWIFVFFHTVYTILFKYRSQIPLYVKMYVLAVSLDSIMIFPYRNGEEAFVWVAVMYISSLYVKQKDKEIKQ